MGYLHEESVGLCAHNCFGYFYNARFLMRAGGSNAHACLVLIVRFGGSGVQGSSIISDCAGSFAGAATSGCGCGMDTGIDRGIDSLLLIQSLFKFAIKSKTILAAKVAGIATKIVPFLQNKNPNTRSITGKYYLPVIDARAV